MRKMLLCFFICIVSATACATDEPKPALINSEYLSGEWQLNDTDISSGGKMMISDCTDSTCNFNIQSWHDSHICDVDGEFSIQNDLAEYKTTKYVYDNKTDTEYNIPVGIRFQILSKNELNLRYVNADSDNAFCGMNATVEGVWVKQ